jgi:hypothetical protein
MGLGATNFNPKQYSRTRTCNTKMGAQFHVAPCILGKCGWETDLAIYLSSFFRNEASDLLHFQKDLCKTAG